MLRVITRVERKKEGRRPSGRRWPANSGPARLMTNVAGNNSSQNNQSREEERRRLREVHRTGELNEG